MKLEDLIEQLNEGLSEDKAVDIFWQKRLFASERLLSAQPAERLGQDGPCMPRSGPTRRDLA
jgi:hypothetical protein